MRRPSEVPGALRGHVFTRAEALQHVSADALRGSAYTRLARGVYTVETEVTHGLRIDAVRKVLGESPVLVGPSAAWALGARLAGRDCPVHVAVTTGVRRQAVLVPHRVAVPPEAVLVTPYGLATTPARTCLDLARGVGSSRWSHDWRVAAVEAVLHATTCRSGDVRTLARSTIGLHGLDEARAVIRLTRDGAESVRETLLRLLIVRNGFVEPERQVEVYGGDGLFVARLDMGWRTSRAGAEYDGAGHREDERHAADLTRHNGLRAIRWRVLQVDKRGMEKPRRFLRQLAEIAPRVL
jgi:hypothetical protein